MGGIQSQMQYFFIVSGGQWNVIELYEDWNKKIPCDQDVQPNWVAGW